MNAFRSSESPWSSAVQFSNSEDPRSDTTMAGRLARSDTSRAYIREVAFRSALRARLLRSEGAAAKVRRVCWDPESETPGGRSALSVQWVRSLRVVHLSSEDPMAPILPSEQVIKFYVRLEFRSEGGILYECHERPPGAASMRRYPTAFGKADDLTTAW